MTQSRAEIRKQEIKQALAFIPTTDGHPLHDHWSSIAAAAGRLEDTDLARPADGDSVLSLGVENAIVYLSTRLRGLRPEPVAGMDTLVVVFLARFAHAVMPTAFVPKETPSE